MAPMSPIQTYLRFIETEFTSDERRKLAEEGEAMPDGSYPIRNGSDLRHAIRAVGLGNDSKSAIHRHIISRAKDLGLEGRLPDEWGQGKKESLIDSYRESFFTRLAEFDQPIPSANSTPADSSKPGSEYVAPSTGSQSDKAQHQKDYQTSVNQGNDVQTAQKTADRNLNTKSPTKGQYVPYNPKTGTGGGNAAVGGTSA